MHNIEKHILIFIYTIWFGFKKNLKSDPIQSVWTKQDKKSSGGEGPFLFVVFSFFLSFSELPC